MPNEPTFHFPKAQRGEIMYPQFTRQALAAGCVGYFVQISGKCIQYFGRNGEIHTEWFLQQTPLKVSTCIAVECYAESASKKNWARIATSGAGSFRYAFSRLRRASSQRL